MDPLPFRAFQSARAGAVPVRLVPAIASSRARAVAARALAGPAARALADPAALQPP